MSTFLRKISQVSINKRFEVIIGQFEEGNKSAFCRKTGIKATTLSNIIGGRQTDPSSKILNSVVEAYPELEALWLLSGRGNMLRGHATITTDNEINEPQNTEDCKLCIEKDKVIDIYKEQLQSQKMRIENLEKDKTWLQKQVDLASDTTK